MDVLGFESANGLRPSLKHRAKVQEWPTPTSRAELDAFLWLTPFLRIFIPQRATRVLQMKKAYLKLIPAEPKLKKAHDDEVEFTRGQPIGRMPLPKCGSQEEDSVGDS